LQKEENLHKNIILGEAGKNCVDVEHKKGENKRGADSSLRE